MLMLRMPPMSDLAGTALTEMNEWSRRAPDPRSSNQGEVARLDEEQQSTLLRWAATQANGGCVADHAARRGAPPAYRLHFGAYKGLTLAQLVSASRTSKGGARALSVSMRRVMS